MIFDNHTRILEGARRKCCTLHSEHFKTPLTCLPVVVGHSRHEEGPLLVGGGELAAVLG